MADKRISQLIERTDILNNDVLPIVASGATTTNKVTISTIQEWMQDNLDVGVTSVGITVGTSGTDVNVTGSPITTSGNITINIPTASATNRGLLSAADWSTFTNDRVPYTGATGAVNLGTHSFAAAQININGNAPTSGSYLGFKHSTNVLSGADGYTSMYTFGTNTIAFKSVSGATTKDFSFSMVGITAGVPGGRQYTLPDASGTLALTSDIPSLTGYVTLATDQTIIGNKTFNSGTLRVQSGGLGGLPSRFANAPVFSIALSGFNTIGFNGSNNLFITRETDTNGVVLAFDNTAVRTYTLQDASGTLAFTSDLSGYVTLGTAQTITATKTFTTSGSGNTININHTSGSGHGLEINKAGNGEGLRVIKTSGSGNAVTISGGLLSAEAATLTGALNGTSAVFSGNTSMITVSYADIDTGNNRGLRIVNTDSSEGTAYNITAGRAGQNNGDFVIRNTTTGVNNLFFNRTTGAATFSSSVTALNGVFKNPGSSPNNTLFIQTSDYSGGSVGSVLRLGHVATTGSTTAIIQNLTAGGTNAGNISFPEGNVGVGTTPIVRFQVQDSANTYVSHFSGLNQTNGIALGTNSSNAAIIQGYTRTFSATNNISMQVDGGNVGIGTASPGQALDVYRDTSVASYVVARNGSGVQVAMGVAGDNGSLIGTLSNHNLRIVTNGAVVATITSGGALQMSNNATTFSIGSISGQNRIQWDSTEFAFLNTANSYTALGASAFNTRSDYRLKENVAPVQDALSKITSLKPCTFNFIAEPEKEVVGFIAHEVQEVFPQAISGEKDGFRIEQVEVSPAELDEEGNVITESVIEEKEVPVYQGIDHSKLVPLLVAAIQEQQEQIKSLTEQVEALKSQING
jgi:hypothetical protein